MARGALTEQAHLLPLKAEQDAARDALRDWGEAEPWKPGEGGSTGPTGGLGLTPCAYTHHSGLLFYPMRGYFRRLGRSFRNLEKNPENRWN